MAIRQFLADHCIAPLGGASVPTAKKSSDSTCAEGTDAAGAPAAKTTSAGAGVGVAPDADADVDAPEYLPELD